VLTQESAWRGRTVRWDRWHVVRVALIVAAFVALAVATVR